MKNAEKTSMSTLAQLVADKTGQNRNVAEDFLKKLFDAIADGLQADGAVKINNFGTFKLQWNEPRKSVDVNTGREILIEGYNKAVFLPEAFLKEKINEPFAYLETVVLDDDKQPEQQAADDIPLQKLDRQAEEIKDILADIRSLDAEAEPETPVEMPVEVPVETPAELPVQPSEPENNAAVVVAETVQAEADATAAVAHQDVKPQEQENMKNEQKEQNSAAQTSQPAAEQPVQKRKSGKGWRIAGCVIIGVICILVILYFALQHKIEQWAANYLDKPAETEVVAEPEPQPEPQPVSIFDQPRVYTEFIKTERLTDGSRLAWLSTKYYGSPYFWVYIYEANQDRIPDPNHILVGTPVKVPKLDAGLIDANNPACLEYARKLHEQYVK